MKISETFFIERPDGDGIITNKFTDPNLLNTMRLALGKGPTEDMTIQDALNTRGPLSNTGLGMGDTVYLQQNPRIPGTQIAALQSHGVRVVWP